MTEPTEAPWHGTLGGYTNHGCRDECCRSAWRQYHRKQSAKAKAAEPTEAPWHGTLGGYTNHGCRDECCRSAWRQYHRKQNAKAKAAEPTEVLVRRMRDAGAADLEAMP